ncbi:MAG: pitrilysin family protein [Bacteroidota bacterium]
MERFYEEFSLPSGIRIVHKQVAHTRVAHCAFILDIGSRDEKAHQQGIAHFWEHMAFKGTNKRKAFHVINRLESLGGELNAYTTKEKICFHASFLDHHYDKAVELLADITFDSIFPQAQIERERSVILEEMAMCQDAPDDAIQDEFDSLIFTGHPLGNNILGTEDSVNQFNQQDFREFIRENLDTHKIVFSSVGNIPFKKVTRLLNKYLSDLPESKVNRERKSFQNYLPQEIRKPFKASQAYCALGAAAFSIHHPQKLPFTLLNNLLGGPSLNSRLNLALREKLGYVYSVESHYTPFSDSGMFAIYFATEAKKIEKSLAVVQRELKNLREHPLGKMQLHQAKEQILGQLAMAEESNLNFMLMMGTSILDSGRVEPLGDVFRELRKIKSEDILEVAQIIFSEEYLSQLIYLPQLVE